MLEFVRRWFERLPPHERDLPLIIHNGVAYSPRAVLLEVERDTPLGRILQAKIEAGSLGTTPEEVENLAKIRLLEVLRRLPPDAPVVGTLGYPPRAYTARELIELIVRGEGIGRKLIETEKRRMQRLVRV